MERGLAEETRKLLLATGCLDEKRLILQKGNFVELPVLQQPPSMDLKVVEQEKPEYKRPRLSFQLIMERLNLQEDEAAALRHWELIGDVLVVKLSDGMARKKEIGDGLLKLIPNANAVVNRQKVQGVYREPKAELIAGSRTETLHKENGCLFKLDPMKVMFSTGNPEERRRMASIVGDGEVVLDMFAGVGQFTIPVAKHSRPKRVFAVEKNPVAFAYLEENVRLNQLQNVYTLLGDCSKVSPQGVADRVIMGFFDPLAFLPAAVGALREEGIIHYHTLTQKKELKLVAERLLPEFKKLGCSIEVLGERLIKSYAPRLWHAVIDLKVHRCQNIRGAGPN